MPCIRLKPYLKLLNNYTLLTLDPSRRSQWRGRVSQWRNDRWASPVGCHWKTSAGASSRFQDSWRRFWFLSYRSPVAVGKHLPGRQIRGISKLPLRPSSRFWASWRLETVLVLSQSGCRWRSQIRSRPKEIFLLGVRQKILVKAARQRRRLPRNWDREGSQRAAWFQKSADLQKQQ